MALPLQFSANGQMVETGAPIPLFATRFGGALLQERHLYVAAPDGQRFLINTVADDATSPITLILNWKPKP